MALVATVEPHLSASEKYRRIRPRAPVEVKVISRVGAPPQWIPARIKNTNKGGAFCRTSTGKEAFFHWNEVRLTADTEAPALVATLGEVVQATALRAVPPIKALPAAPEPPALAASSPADAGAALGQRSAVLLISREDLGMPPTKKTTTKKTTQRRMPIRPTKNAPPNSAIGDLWRAKRLERNLAQRELAKLLAKGSKGAIWNSRISLIELGKTLPNDDELLSFAEAFASDIDELIRLRNADRAGRARSTPPALAPAPVRLLAAPPVSTDALAQFLEGLCALVPLPLDLEKRRVWFQLAMRLHELGRAP